MLSLKDIYLKEKKADYDYDREDDEDAFGEPLPDDDELKPGEIDSMNLDLTQQDKIISKLINKNTGYMDLPAIIAQIKDDKVEKALTPILTKWEEVLKKYPDVAKELKLNSNIVKLQNIIVQQSFFYKHNKDPKSKKYIFQTKKFDKKIKELNNGIKTIINKVKGSVDKKNTLLKAYNELYNNMMELKKDHQLSVRIKEIIRETIKENMDDRLKAAMGKSGFDDDETSDFFSKDTPSTMGIGGTQKARTLVSTLRSDYREMSDEELDEFSAEMVEHFLDNTAAQARAKVFFAKKGI